MSTPSRSGSAGRPDAPIRRGGIISRPAVRWISRLLLAAALFAVAFSLRSRGGNWSRLHPDNENMTRWLRWTLDQPYVRERVYPGGFFTLFRPYQKLELARAAARLERESGPRDSIPTPLEIARHRHNVIFLARRFNAFLGALTCLILLLLAWSVTGSFGASFFAAVLAALDPWHIEHCHYAETDIAMVFTLSLALLLWARAEKKPGTAVFLLAALASGFAGGVKYPLLLLVAWIPVFAWRAPRRRPALLTAAGLLVFLLGFVWADPALLLDPRWFLGEMGEAAAGVASETRGVVGLAYGRPFARVAHQLRWGYRFFRAPGLVRMAVILAGTVVLLRRPLRGFWRSTLLFPLIYAAFLIGLSPWIRMQELLAFMPFFACAASAAGWALWQWNRAGAGRTRLRGAVVMLLAAGVVLPAGIGGTRRANLFTFRDTRHYAQDWLQSRFPRGTILGAEIYTKSQPGRPVPVPELEGLYKIEWRGIGHARDRGVEYLLRNATLPGRGAFNPFTGRLYSQYERYRREFFDNSELLAAWSPFNPEDEVTFAFANPELRLYGLRRFRERLALEVPLLAPCPVRTEEETGCFPVGRRLAPLPAVLIDPTPRSLVIGGPDYPRSGLFLVLRGVGGGSAVRVRALGRVMTIDPEMGETVSVFLTGLPVRPAVKRFESIRLKAETVGRRAARAVFDRWEAAALLLESGQPRDALRLLEDPETVNERLVRFLAAAEAGLSPHPADLAQARETTRLLREAASLTSRDLRVNGVSGYYLDRFARLYLGARDTACRADSPPPGVLLPAGRWRFRAEARREDDSGWTPVGMDLFIDHEEWLELPAGPVQGFVEYRNAEIYWTLRDQLEYLRERIGRALAFDGTVAGVSPPL